MSVLALVLYVVWLLVAMAVRIVIQVRRTGDSGFRVPAGWKAVRDRVGGGAFAAALLLGFAGVALSATGTLQPIDALDVSALNWIATVVAVLGIALTLFTQLAMGDSWRIGVDHEERTDLVTGGPFALVRNPIYSAMFVTATGLALMVPNAVTLAGLVGLAVALEIQVRLVEEPYLRQVHPEQFAAYTRQVGRFVPRVGRRRTRSLEPAKGGTNHARG